MCANPWWWSIENMRFLRQSSVEVYMNRTQWGPRCLFLLITPHLWQVLCCIFNEMERRATAFISHLTFFYTVKLSVRDDKLQFGVRSNEILTRASSKPPNQLVSDIFINQWDGAHSWKTKCFSAVRLTCWLLLHIKIFSHLGYVHCFLSLTTFLWFTYACNIVVHPVVISGAADLSLWC